uniref:Uncharacterized protein n=1 Tax=viral metagenome TaxID=1070528 RepID=A0A6M3JXC8_9ZZZZ
MWTKTDKYKIGINHIRCMLDDKSKERAVAFENGDPIELSEEELRILMPLRWVKEIKEGE